MTNDKLINLLERLKDQLPDCPLRKETDLAVAAICQREDSVGNWALDIMNSPMKQLLELLAEKNEVTLTHHRKLSGEFYRLEVPNQDPEDYFTGTVLGRAIERAHRRLVKERMRS